MSQNKFQVYHTVTRPADVAGHEASAVIKTDGGYAISFKSPPNEAVRFA